MYACMYMICLKLISQIQTKIKRAQEKQNGKPLSILMIGKTGAGKSALVNGLVGKKVSVEGAILTAVTKEVKSYEFTKGDTPFIVFDSRGLQDAAFSDTKTLQQIRTKLVATCKCSEVDLVVYCLDMTRLRIEASDVAAINHLTEGFTDELWKRAVFVLTFANRVEPSPEYSGTDEEFFRERLQQFVTEIRQLVPGVSIPVVPVGYWLKTNRIPEPYKLPDREDWFNDFWFTCLSRMEEGAAISLLLSQASRIKVKPATGEVESEGKDGEIHQRPLYLNEDSGWLGFIAAEATGAGLGGLLGYLGVSGAITTGGNVAATTTGTAMASGTGVAAAASTADAACAVGVGAVAGGALTTVGTGLGFGVGGKGEVVAAALTINSGPLGLTIGGIVGLCIAYFLYRQVIKKK